MNCQEALDLLYEIIDKEASDIDTQRVQEHLEKCHKCLEVYRLEESVQELIKEKVKDHPEGGKVEGLKLKILDRLDELDETTDRGGHTNFFRLSTRMLVAAASLVLLLGVALISANFMRHEDRYSPLEEAHLAVNDTMASYDDSEATAQLISYIHDQHRYNVASDVSDFHLVGGHSEEVMGIQMPHLVYANGHRIVSVFIVPSDKFEITPDLKKSLIEKKDVRFFDHHCKGCRLVFHQVGSAIVITASNDEDLDLTDFIPGQLQAI
ncbi:MAG TPA: zf-HC2 domain-containing protein [candidate division Zixibacteria bacterium]|nr:zf-HC2 domain-containing protein [candidate division Zixibacteria bacterium]